MSDEKNARMVTRRGFLKSMGIGVGLVAAMPLLQACGGEQAPAAAPTSAPAAEATKAPDAAAEPTKAPEAAAEPTTAPEPTQGTTSSASKIKILVATGGAPELPKDDPYWMDWLTPFNEANPNIEVNLEGYGSDPEVKFLTQFIAGSAPHIWITTRWGTLGNVVGLDGAIDLSDRVATWEDAKAIKEACMNVGKIKGVQYALPWGDVCDAYVTRKSWYEEACDKAGMDPAKGYDATWTFEEDFDKVMLAMSNPDEKRWGLASMGNTKFSIARWWFQSTVQSYGYDIVADDGQGGLNATFVTPGAIEVAKMYQRGISQQFIPRDAATWDFDQASNAWYAGVVGTIIAGRWVKANAIKNLQDDFVALAIPSSTSRPSDSWYAGNLHIGFMTNSNKDKETEDASWAVLSNMCSKEVQTKFTVAGTVPFPVRTDMDAAAIINEPYWPGMVSSLQKKAPPPTFPSHERLEEVYVELSKAVGQLLSEPDADPEAVLAEAQGKAELLLTRA